ncbi:MAG: lipoprotein signal peptidase [Bacteroidales bacterium]|nr:lipoprotein signal peptidase [Bacteroidales bacterium]
MKKPLLLIFAVLVIDQIIKIYVKTHFFLSEEIEFLGLSWFRIHFIENKGMAFGMSFGDNIGKFILTFVRIIASVLIFIYLTRLVKKNEKPLIIYSFALIFAGAAGNIIDSLFYGVLFSKSTFFQVATFLPEGGGYAPMLFGKVVDMFYFPLIDTDLPAWIPLFGGKHISFFDAIFNFSDAAITIGVVLLIIGIYIKDKTDKKDRNDKVICAEDLQSGENTEL